jgi:hypothetical protein
MLGQWSEGLRWDLHFIIFSVQYLQVGLFACDKKIKPLKKNVTTQNKWSGMGHRPGKQGDHDMP